MRRTRSLHITITLVISNIIIIIVIRGREAFSLAFSETVPRPLSRFDTHPRWDARGERREAISKSCVLDTS